MPHLVISTTDLLGWGSSVILLATLVRQVYTQWRTRATAGVSRWLLIGQCTASIYVSVSTRSRQVLFTASTLARIDAAKAVSACDGAP